MVAAVAAVTATAVSAAFTVQLGRRAIASGPMRAAMRAWTIALGMFCAASAAMAVGTIGGWSEPLFRAFYLFGAVLNVVWLAHGSSLANAQRTVTSRVVAAVMVVTCLVLVRFAVDEPALYGPSLALGAVWAVAHLPSSPSWLARTETAVVWAWTVVAAWVVVSAAFVGPLPVDGLPEGRDLYEESVRGVAVAGNSFGSLVVIVGALASSAEQVWRWPGRRAGERLRDALAERAREGRGWVDAIADWVFVGRRGIDLAGRVRGNLLIALGVVVAALGGALSFLGDTTGHAVGLTLGVVIMYAGFRGAVAPTASAAAADARAGTPRAAAGVLADRLDTDPDRRPPRVVVYTRAGCGLCRAAEELALAEAKDVVLVDIDADPALQRRYNVRVPVVTVDDREVAEGHVTEGEIAAAVEHALAAGHRPGPAGFGGRERSP